MLRETRHLTVTVDGDERDATWKQGVGIYVAGHDIGKGDTVKIEGTTHEVTDMRRMQMHGEAVTLIIKAKDLDTFKTCRRRSLLTSCMRTPSSCRKCRRQRRIRREMALFPDAAG